MRGMGYVEDAKNLTDELEGLQRMVLEVKERRLAAMRGAIGAGVSYSALADRMGVSRGRVNQLLGSQGGGGGRPAGVYRGKSGGGSPARGEGAPVDPPIQAVEAPKPAKVEEHRHRYVSTGWNHAKGAYLLRQECACGAARVVPSPRIPGELRSKNPDTTIRE